VLGTSDYAGFILANAAIAVGEMFSDFGTRIWAIRNHALGMGLRDGLRFIMVAKVGYTTLFGAALFVLMTGQLSVELRLLIALVAFVQPSTDPLLWLFQGREQLYLEALFTLVWRIAVSAAMYVVADMTHNLSLILTTWLLASLVRVAAELLWIWWRGFGRSDPAASSWHGSSPRLLRTSAEVFPVGCAFVLMCLYQRVGIFALSHVTDVLSVALYGTAFSLVTVPGFVAMSVSSSLFPRLSRHVHSSDVRAATNTANQGLMVIAFIFAIISIGGVIAAPLVFGLLLPPRLYAGYIVTQILFPGLYISSLSVFLKYCMNALSLNVHDAGASALGIVLFLLVLTVPNWRVPVQGAALAWNIGESSIFVLRGAMIARDGRISMRRAVELGTLYFVLIAVAYGIAPIADSLNGRMSAHHLRLPW